MHGSAVMVIDSHPLAFHNKTDMHHWWH